MAEEAVPSVVRKADLNVSHSPGEMVRGHLHISIFHYLFNGFILSCQEYMFLLLHVVPGVLFFSYARVLDYYVALLLGIIFKNTDHFI